jgi:hypothetical protein
MAPDQKTEANPATNLMMEISTIEKNGYSESFLHFPATFGQIRSVEKRSVK